MKYLNLTEGFNPYNAEEKDCIKFESFFFNGGEPHIKLEIDDPYSQDEIEVTSRLRNMNEFMMLVVATEALSQSGIVEIRRLFVPYFTGARQDRRMVEGEPLTIKVFANIINNFEYDEVKIFDPHSDVTSALLDNCTVISNHKLVQLCLEYIARDVISTEDNPIYYNLISPDSGANKKSSSLVEFLSNVKESINIDNVILTEGAFGGEDRLIKCDKTRNTKTGKLSGFEVYSDDLKGRNCIIVDDICDGGGTFVGLAEELKKKNAGDLYLIVSHGIFSKGFKELKKHFKAIYTTNSWVNNYAMEIPEIEKGSHIVNVIDFKEFI